MTYSHAMERGREEWRANQAMFKSKSKFSATFKSKSPPLKKLNPNPNPPDLGKVPKSNEIRIKIQIRIWIFPPLPERMRENILCQHYDNSSGENHASQNCDGLNQTGMETAIKQCASNEQC